MNLIAEKMKPNGQTYSPDCWHTYLKGKFLGMQEFELPSGQTMIRANSSAKLDTSEFGDYMMQVEAWAAENGVWLDE